MSGRQIQTPDLPPDSGGKSHTHSTEGNNKQIESYNVIQYCGCFEEQPSQIVLVQACLRAPPVVADEAKLAIVFTYFFLSSFFFLRLLLFTHFGESPVRENLFPTIFWHNQKIYAKKNIFLVNFNFFTKKSGFSHGFSERPAFSHGAWTNPSSLEY